MLSPQMDHSDVRASHYEDHGFWTHERLGWQVFDAERHPDRQFPQPGRAVPASSGQAPGLGDAR